VVQVRVRVQACSRARTQRQPTQQQVPHSLVASSWHLTTISTTTTTYTISSTCAGAGGGCGTGTHLPIQQPTHHPQPPPLQALPPTPLLPTVACFRRGFLQVCRHDGRTPHLPFPTWLQLARMHTRCTRR
jgi:hypothetical protein